MKRSLLIAAILMGLTRGLSAVQTPIYPVLSDKGIAGEDIYVFGSIAGNSVRLSSTATNPPAPEGQYSFQAQAVGGPGSTWGVFFLNPNRSNRAVDLSAYNNGEIRFWANCTSDNFNVFVQHLNGVQEGYNYAGSFGGQFNQWVPVVYPIGPVAAAIPTTDMDSPFEIEANQN